MSTKHRSAPHPQVHSPSSEDELATLIATAAGSGRVLRVVGSAHSVARAIAGPKDLLVSLQNMRSVLAYDPVHGTIEVQAGMTLGPSPQWADRPADQTLCGYLQAQVKPGAAWALPDLGGITHQTVGGFLSTGSCGGSVQYSFGDAVQAIRFMDAAGESHRVQRGDELFDALAVSMGLLGVITSVTFQCEPWYDVIGRETTSLTADCEVDLFGAGPNSLREFLTRTPYARLLWWPQPGVNKITVWQARRMDRADYLAQHCQPLHLKARPYAPIGLLGQLIADGFYSVLALRYGHSLLDRAIEAVTPLIAPTVINAFVPTNATEPTLFWDCWQDALPMDNTSSDQLMPTDFTELWIPIEHTQQVMCALRDHYRDNGLSAAGTYACEIYAAKRSPFMLSPSCGKDMVRIDVFWFAKNLENAATGFYPQFWQLLAGFGFRPHWGKTLPAASSDTGSSYLRSQYPQWDRFMQLRRELDPGGVFLSSYWQRHLGIDAAAVAPRHSMVVPRGEADEETLGTAERQAG